MMPVSSISKMDTSHGTLRKDRRVSSALTPLTGSSSLSSIVLGSPVPSNRSPLTLNPAAKSLADKFASVETGIIHRYAPTTFAVISERDPIWILALHSSFVKSLVLYAAAPARSDGKLSSLLRGFQSASEFGLSLNDTNPRHSLFNNALRQLGLHRLKFSTSLEPLKSVDIILVSGSIVLYNDLVDILSSNKVIFIHDSHYTKRALPPSSLPIRRLLHTSTGGATSYVGVCGYHNLPVVPHTTLLQRRIKHFLDYSIPPNRHCPRVPSLSEQQRLPIPALNSTIAFITSFSATGKGFRPLTSTELGAIFGLSSTLSSYTTRETFPFTPVQLLDALLRPSLHHISHPAATTSQMLSIHTVHQLQFTYFPSIHKYLSNSWAAIHENEVTDKAAKADDAAPVFRHWYDRITGFFSNAETLITPLQRCLMRWIRRRFLREFLHFLDLKYGVQWPLLLGLRTNRAGVAFRGDLLLLNH